MPRTEYDGRPTLRAASPEGAEHTAQTAEEAHRDALIQRGDEILSSRDANATQFAELVGVMIELVDGKPAGRTGLDATLGTAVHVPTEDPTSLSITLHHTPEGPDTRPGGNASIIITETTDVARVVTTINYGRGPNGETPRYNNDQGPLVTTQIEPRPQVVDGMAGLTFVKAAPETTTVRPINRNDRGVIGNVFDVCRKLPPPAERNPLPEGERPTAKMIGNILYEKLRPRIAAAKPAAA